MGLRKISFAKTWYSACYCFVLDAFYCLFPGKTILSFCIDNCPSRRLSKFFHQPCANPRRIPGDKWTKAEPPPEPSILTDRRQTVVLLYHSNQPAGNYISVVCRSQLLFITEFQTLRGKLATLCDTSIICQNTPQLQAYTGVVRTRNYLRHSYRRQIIKCTVSAGQSSAVGLSLFLIITRGVDRCGN